MNLREYEAVILETAVKSEAAIEDVLIVPSVYDWCSQNGVEEQNQNRTGKCLRNRDTGKHLILLNQEITEDQVSNIKAAMSMRGSSHDQIQSIRSDIDFIKHLVLHECAHASDPDWSELECDNWAFVKLAAL